MLATKREIAIERLDDRRMQRHEPALAELGLADMQHTARLDIAQLEPERESNCVAFGISQRDPVKVSVGQSKRPAQYQPEQFAEHVAFQVTVAATVGIAFRARERITRRGPNIMF